MKVLRNNWYVFLLLIFTVFIGIFFFCNYNSDNTTTLDDVKLKEEIKSNESFAIMVEQSDGTYTQSDSNAWPTDMKYNSEKSGCMDANGNIISESLTYDSSTNTATVKTKGATYCYLYFDIIPTLSELCSNGDNLGSCLTTNNSEIDS